MAFRIPNALALTAVLATSGALAGVAPDRDEPATGSGPQGALELRFRDFFQSPHGPLGLQMTTALRAADGLRVRLTGYMVTQEQPLCGHFFLTPLPLTMSVHSDGDADDLPPATVLVLMPAQDRDLPLLRTRGLLQLTGQLQVGRHEMADGRVVWVRLELEPRPAAAGEPDS
jgi:hypothetical protein